ncbi:MAG: hypothetical protein V3S73_01725 [Gammaproteobacteria bacterium]
MSRKKEVIGAQAHCVGPIKLGHSPGGSNATHTRVLNSAVLQAQAFRQSLPIANPLRIILTHCLTAPGKQCLNSAQTGACNDNPMIAAWAPEITSHKRSCGQQAPPFLILGIGAPARFPVAAWFDSLEPMAGERA